jgi:hypothetical protein
MLTNRLKDLTRFQAFGYHFLVSAIALSSIFAIVRWVWYPSELFSAANGSDLFQILALVDVILGPLIMLIIFNPKKASLKFDVTCVLVCQLAFMGYGAWSIYITRPAFIVYTDNQFVLMKATELESKDLDSARNPNFKSLPNFGPVVVGTQLTDAKTDRQKLPIAGIEDVGVQNLPQYYAPYDDVKEQVKKGGFSAKTFPDISADEKEKLLQYEVQHKAESAVRFFKLKNKVRPLFVVVDASTGNFLTIL